MQWTLYTGRRRTFVTPVSIDECWRRLRDDVQQLSPIRDYFMGKWAPLGIDNSVVRLIDGEGFELRTKPPSRNNITWMFEGRFETVAGQTKIVGQYRLSRAETLRFFGGPAAALIAITMLTYRALIYGMSRETLLVVVFAVILIAGVRFLTHRNEEQPYEEAHLVRTLQQLFDAEEFPAHGD